MLTLQKELAYKYDPKFFENRTEEDIIRAINEEISEFISTIPWKWWAKPSNKIALIELVDIMHFFLTLVLLQNAASINKSSKDQLINEFINGYELETNLTNTQEYTLEIAESMQKLFINREFPKAANAIGRLIKNTSTIEDIYLFFKGKHTLNKFRIERGGYRLEPGELKPQIDDNMVLFRVINQNKDKPLEEVESILKQEIENYESSINIDNIERDIEFLFEIGCMRYIKRSWVQFMPSEVANNTEHTFRVIWIALLLAKYEGITNTGKIAKMALVHDICESRSGDAHYIWSQYQTKLEEQAISDTLLGTIIFEELLDLWKEFEGKKTIEAKIVKDADNLDVELELIELKHQGHQKIYDHLSQRRGGIIDSIYRTETAKRFYKLIHDSDPHSWHINSNNRFKSGYWTKTK